MTPDPEVEALKAQLAEREGVQATFLTGDMREIPFESHFDAIINLSLRLISFS